MKILPIGVTEKYRIEICFVNLIMLFYLFRTAIPLLKFPFMPLYFGFIVYSLINYKKQIVSTLIEFVRNYYLLLFLALILVISFLLSNKVYLIVFKDVVNMIILLSIFFISTIVVSGKKELKFYVTNLVYLVVLFAFFISILGLVVLLDIFTYKDFSLIAGISSDDSAAIDYNFALLPVFFGVFGVLYFLRKTSSKLQIICYNFLLIIFSFDIILSGSRRGLITLMVIFLILTISKLFMLFKKNKFLKELSSNCGFFILSLISIIFILSLFFFHTSFKFKNRTLQYLGTKNVIIAKSAITRNIFRYVSAIDKKTSFSKLNEKIWTVSFDPKDPDSGWGSKIHKTIFPLTGKNVEIVPAGVNGYLMDSTCNSSYYSENNLSESYTILKELIANKGDCYKASVYCFVSNDFDGSTVSFGNIFSSNEKVIIAGKTNIYYNLMSKGKWEKLEIVYKCNRGVILPVLSFTKNGARDFSNLKGYVIFAYPQFEKIDSTDYNTFSNIPFDPKDPDSGWGNRIHKTIFPLTGKNVEIVTNGAKGYLMDSTCNASYYTENDLSESYTLLVNLKVNKGDQYRASVYCFVSDNYDGNTASFGVGSFCIYSKIVSGKVSTFYNLERKGVWQKLEVEFVCNEGEVPIYMSFLKRGVKDFSKLNGYVIFAYPKYEKINKTNNGLSHGITQSKSNSTESGIIDLAKNEVDQKNNESLNQLEEINNTNNSYSAAYDIVIPHYIIPSITFPSNTQKYFSSGVFCFPLSILIASDSIQNDNDPVRKWVSNFISEDTTYYPHKANITLDTISDSFIGDRISRWNFALQIFSKEYNWKQKIFGSGFNFLNWYGFYFYRDKTRSDYPHNPFLSILLYSGIFGLIIYIIFMFKVFYYYIKYFKEYKILSVFFIITFFFSFFSAGSPFDPPIMGFFVILPFFIHCIHKKNRPELN